MKINSNSLRITTVVILFKILLKLSAVESVLSLLPLDELPFNIYTFINGIALLIEIYIIFYFLTFLNQFLTFTKVNIMLYILLVITFLQFIYIVFMPFEIPDYSKGNQAFYFMMGVGAITTVTKMIFSFRLLKYRGIFRKQIVLFASSEFCALALQIGLIPLVALISHYDYSFVKYGLLISGFFPSIALLLLYYKALKQPNLSYDVNSSDVLDSREFSS
jgi:hypothetical protein